jgi:hypothetical protein
MYEFFIYDYFHQTTASQKQQRFSIVFSSSSQIDDAGLVESLRIHFATAMPPDAVVLVGTEGNHGTLESLASSSRVSETLPAMTRYLNPPTLNAIWICSDGTLSGVGARVGDLTSKAFLDRVVQEGLLRIFTDRQGMLDTVGRYHYVKPSGKHSDRFIRTANVLMRGAEVDFIAFSLLPHLQRRTITHIYTDTAAINAAAYALVALRQSFDKSFKMPTIDSFSSYGGLGSFKFEGLPDSLILISASTSHELELQLVNQHKIPQEQIVTIYYLGNPLTGSKVLCDLTKDKDRNPNGFDPIVSFPRDDCGLCKQGLLAITIAGDQFLPENPKVIPEIVSQKDAPSWLTDFMKDFVGRGVIACHRPGRNPTPGREHELYLDLSAVLGSPRRDQDTGKETGHPKKFSEHLEYLLTQVTPASLQRIIYLDDPASRALAEMVRTKYSLFGAAVLPVVVSASEVSSNLEKHTLEVGTTMVVASVIVSGRSLLAISQALRQIQTNHSVQYLVGVARTRSQQRLEEVQRNVQHGEYGLRDHKFDMVRAIFVPDEQASPWTEERAFLIGVRDRLSAQSEHLPLIEGRIDELDSGKDAGLRDNIFWRNSADSSPLQLRSGFAFWDFDYSARKFTQAEVYFTMSAVLHHFRAAHRRGAEGAQVAYHRVVLSPRNFARFNDGVIQAALLRAAYPWEINYSIDQEASADMKRILEAAFVNIGNQLGEAGVEFLLALAMGKLRLARSDEQDLLQQLRASEQRGSVKPFAEYWAAGDPPR